jgi:hypothetical protein
VQSANLSAITLEGNAMSSLVSQVVDAVKAAVTLPTAGPVKAPPRLQKARGDLALAESKLGPARAAEAAARAKHEETAFELLSRDDDGAAIARSSATVAAATGHVQDVEAAIRVAQKNLADAADAADADSLADAWEVAASLWKRRDAAIERSQKLLDQWLGTLPGLREATEDAYRALPTKPDFRPIACTSNGMAALIELHVFGHSDGWICQRSGSSSHVAKQRPSLSQQAADMSARLLAADPRRRVAS